MATLARDSITVAWQKDIASVTWYYKIQSSTANPPAKPTTATPSGWSTTEPTYTEGSTNSLYVCQKTTYSDSTFEYSDVSLSSSYEAAKTAYNKAVNAAKTATNYITDVTNDGVWVTPSDAKPVNGQAANTTSGWHISDAIELFRNGVSYLKAWIDNTKAKIRIGLESAGHTLFSENGMDVYKGSSKVASFGEESYVGVNDGSHSYVKIDFHSMSLIDKDGNVYFKVADLRGATGTVELTETMTGDGQTLYYTDYPIAVPSTVSITINGTETTNFYTPTAHSRLIHFKSNIASGSVIAVTYETDADVFKYFTMGTRLSSSDEGIMSFASGQDVTSSGECSHAEGKETVASGDYSHAEGYNTTASERYCHAEGDRTTASKPSAHAEGYGTTASENHSHAEGQGTTASGECAHAEGYKTTAEGYASHSSGNSTSAHGNHSAAFGNGTRANSNNQLVCGEYNTGLLGSSNLFEVGNGTSASNRSNAFSVDEDGNVKQAGNIYCC